MENKSVENRKEFKKCMKKSEIINYLYNLYYRKIKERWSISSIWRNKGWEIFKLLKDIKLYRSIKKFK